MRASASAHALLAICTTLCCRVSRRSCRVFQAAIYKLPEGAADASKTLEVAVDQASDAITRGQGCRARIAHIHG